MIIFEIVEVFELMVRRVFVGRFLKNKKPCSRGEQGSDCYNEVLLCDC